MWMECMGVRGVWEAEAAQHDETNPCWPGFQSSRPEASRSVVNGARTGFGAACGVQLCLIVSANISTLRADTAMEVSIFVE